MLSGENPLRPFRAEKLPPEEKSWDFPDEDLGQTVAVESGDFMENSLTNLEAFC